MKNQALFSWKDKSKKLKCHLLQFLFGALKVKCSGAALYKRGQHLKLKVLANHTLSNTSNRQY